MASNTYLASGIYRVSLTVTDNDAESDVGETIAVIGEGNLPPTADAAGPYAADVGVDINFNGSASSDPDGTIMSWDWNFGDDTTGSGEMVTHAYAASADYNVTLTVTDDDGTPASASTVAQVAAVADLSVGAISVSPSSVGLGAEATYTIPVNNAGPSEDPGVTALITLPGNATFGSSSATQGTCAEDAGTVTCDLGAIAGAGSATITVIVTAPSEPSSMTLSASVSGLAIDPTPDDNTASSDVSVQDTIDVTVEVRGGGSVGPLEFAFAALFVGIALLMRRRAVPMVTVAALAILLYPASDSWAQTDNVWYIGGSAGSSQGNYDANDLTSDLSGLGWSLSNASVDDSDTAWKVFGGVNLSKVFGVEAGYFDLGEITSTFDASVTPAEVDELLRDASEVDGFLASGIYAAGTARFSFADDRFAIFGKAGFAAWNKETNATVINGATGAGAAEDSGVNGMLGIGANWYFLRNFGVRAEYERYNVGRWVDMISVGVEYKFD